MIQHEKINYVEFPARDLAAAKQFFQEVFDWAFTDYGAEYTAFSNAGLKGGFYKADLCSSTEKGAALIVFYSPVLEQTLTNIEKAGGIVVKPIFEFPGGRRFHFTDPNGNEFAVWSE
mgnify:CR=1 FL=1